MNLKHIFAKFKRKTNFVVQNSQEKINIKKSFVSKFNLLGKLKKIKKFVFLKLKNTHYFVWKKIKIILVSKTTKKILIFLLILILVTFFKMKAVQADTTLFQRFVDEALKARKYRKDYLEPLENRKNIFQKVKLISSAVGILSASLANTRVAKTYSMQKRLFLISTISHTIAYGSTYYEDLTYRNIEIVLEKLSTKNY